MNPWENIRGSAVKRMDVWLDKSATLQLLIYDARNLMTETPDVRTFMDRLETEILNTAPVILRPQLMAIVMACIYGADVTLDEEEKS